MISKKKRVNTREIIADTLGLFYNDVSDYRYQSTKTKQAVYAVGNGYYIVSKSKPKDDMGGDWELYPDQFAAERAGTYLWWVNGGE